MRFVARMIALVALAIGFTIVSATSSGGWGAAAFLLAHVIAALTVAVIMAPAVDRLANRPLREVPDRGFTGHCHECGRPLLQVSSVWFCRVCDRAPAYHLPYVGRRR
jgi:ribosomal protein S14